MKNYQHKVDKSQIPVCNIMGVNIAAINMEWLLDFTEKNIKENLGDFIVMFVCWVSVGENMKKIPVHIVNGSGTRSFLMI